MSKMILPTILVLLVIFCSFMLGLEHQKHIEKDKLLIAKKLDDIGREQIEKMRPKAYVFVYNDKKHIYLSSKDKATEYLQKNYKKIERVWSCNRDQI